MGIEVRIRSTRLAGVAVAETTFHSDQRGAFGRLFCERELAPILRQRRIVQINHSRTSAAGTVRGLHYQRPPQAEMKFVRCLRGRVWDVAVDLRTGSPTFLNWHAEELTPENGLMMIISEGFAHGFQAIEAESELLYLHTAFYAPELEGGIRHDDTRLAISWPLIPRDVSARDSSLPSTADFPGLTI